jgi:hypothetical protein
MDQFGLQRGDTLLSRASRSMICASRVAASRSPGLSCVQATLGPPPDLEGAARMSSPVTGSRSIGLSGLPAQ